MQKKMKLLIISLLILTGCTSVDNFLGKPGYNPSMQDLSLPVNQKIVQDSVNLRNGGSERVLEDIKNNWKNNLFREYSLNSRDNVYEIYAGEFFTTKDEGVKSFVVVNTKADKYDTNRKNGYYSFRSIYQGAYDINVNYIDGRTKTIRVLNKMKYRFTEGESYDIIRSNYNSGRVDEALSGIDLHSMAFPTSPRGKELDFISLNIFINKQAFKEGKAKLAEIKKEKNLSEPEMVSLFNSEIILSGNNYNVEPYYLNYATYYRELATNIKNYLISKGRLTGEERIFLERENYSANDPMVSQVLAGGVLVPGTVINVTRPSFESGAIPVQGNQDYGNVQNVQSVQQVDGTVVAAKEYESGKTAYEKGRYNEAILFLLKAQKAGDNSADLNYYLADSYFKTENYDNAVKNYKVYLNSAEDGIRKAESYYNCGVAYDKIGNKELANSTLKKTMELFPGTSWARKANIYIVRLKTN